jgi:predicted small metal-binding protein
MQIYYIFLMSQIFEDCIRSFCIHCEDIGLDCNCIIYGNTADKVMDEIFMHMFEYHAINPEEMTTSMRLKIKENLRIHSRSDCMSGSNCTVF